MVTINYCHENLITMFEIKYKKTTMFRLFSILVYSKYAEYYFKVSNGFNKGSDEINLNEIK